MQTAKQMNKDNVNRITGRISFSLFLCVSMSLTPIILLSFFNSLQLMYV